jgi:transposase
MMTTVCLHQRHPVLVLGCIEATPEEWAAIPEHVRRGIERLWNEHQQLREQLGLTSRNSSKLPSSDPPSAPKREAKPPTGRSPGGQPGHPGHTRELVPEDQVQALIPVRPPACQHCGHAFPAEARDAHPQRHQVVELPRVVAEVTEYQLHTLTCPHCGTQTPADLPPGVPAGLLGPRAVATIATCTGQYHLSKRATATVLEDFFGLTVSDATICTAEQAVSATLAAPAAEVAVAVREASVKHVDETSWRQQRDPDPPPTSDDEEEPAAAPAPPEKLPKAWLWIVVTAVATLFSIRRSRGGAVAKELLGDEPIGIVVSDRYSAYAWIGALIRQLCWAHLRRDFTNISERAGAASQLGHDLLAATHQLFTLWHRYRDGTLTWPDFQAQMAPVRETVGELLRAGAALPNATSTAATCAHLVKWEEALWTFTRVEGVAPTNNAAERGIRPGVLFRHTSFGTQSSAGSRFVERVMTAVATCKQHRRNVLDYLTTAVTAAHHGTPAPSLLPPTPTAR